MPETFHSRISVSHLASATGRCSVGLLPPPKHPVSSEKKTSGTLKVLSELDHQAKRVLFRLWRGLMFTVENYNFKKMSLRISWCQSLFSRGFQFRTWLRPKAEVLSACGLHRSIPPQVRKNLRCPKGTLRVRSPSSKNGMDLYNELRLCYRMNPTASDNQNISVLKKCICLVF